MNLESNAKGSAVRLQRAALLLIVLVIAWLLWSGIFKPLLLILGAFSCLLTVYITHRMGYFNNQAYALRFGLRLVAYWAWLGREIWRSSLEVTRIVISPTLNISPQIVEIKASSDHPVDQVILGNSITLTPGTVALDLYKGTIKVHCLTKEGADDLVAGEMDRRVTALRQT